MTDIANNAYVHRLPIQVYYEDTDAAGVVYYANYLKFMERGRTEFLRAFGFQQTQLLDEFGVIFVVRSVNIDFLRPARFDDQIEVLTQIEQFRRVSMGFQQEISQKGKETKLCSGTVQVACLQAESFRPTAFPEKLRARLEKIATIRL